MDKIDLFLEKLINLTTDKKITWTFLIEYMGESEELKPGSNLFNSFEFQNEWVEIVISQSFATKVENLGRLFLIYRIDTSAIDGFKTKGYKLYIQPKFESKIMQIPMSDEQLYYLANVVAYYRSSSENNLELDGIIDDFLKQ